MKRLFAVAFILIMIAGTAQAINILDYSYAIQYRLMKADPDFEPEVTEFVIMERSGKLHTIGAFGSIAFVDPDKLTINMVLVNLLDDNGKPLTGKARTKAIAVISAMENFTIFIDDIMASLNKAPLDEAEKILDLIYNERPKAKIENFMIHSTDSCTYMATSTDDVFAIMITRKE